MKLFSIIAALVLLVPPAYGQYRDAADSSAAGQAPAFRPVQLVAPGVLIGTGTLIHCFAHEGWDGAVNDVFSGLPGSAPHTEVDDWIQYAPFVADLGLALTGVPAENSFLDRTIECAVSVIVLTAVTQTMKSVINSPRPIGDSRSFPSGHTATAFTGAELVRLEYGWGWGAGAYAVAAAVGVLRMYNGAHWFSDVLTGAGIGILCAHAGRWLLEPVKGLFGKPTILNNVETWANINPIIIKGAKWFSSIGTENSKGTKVFALGGKITNVGLVEVPMGTTLRTIVEEIGGGIPNGKKFKAAQTGGPSGGCIPASCLDVPIDYDNLKKIGSMMGSGGMIILDEDTCMVDISKFYLEFTADESCGKCNPCRIGTKRLLELLTKITKGEGELSDIDKIRDLAEHMKSSSLCALGQSAPNPILSTLRYFEDEYRAHIVDKKCTAGVCKSLLSYYIVPDKCRGCTLCKRNCPVGAIEGNLKQPHAIDTTKCIRCGVCITKCNFGAIIKK